MKCSECMLILMVAVGFMAGCSEKPNMGSPVGKWEVFDANVAFGDDGSVVWHNDGADFNPRFLDPLKKDDPGTWKTDGQDLFLTTRAADGTTKTQRYEYSVGTDGNGNPAMDISSPEGASPDRGSYVFKKQ